MSAVTRASAQLSLSESKGCVTMQGPQEVAGRMRRIAGWLCPREVVVDLDVPDKEGVLKAAAAIIGRLHQVDPAPVFRALSRREQVGSTAIGQGIAIPHARINGIERPLTLYIRPRHALPFAATDGKPVNSILVIIVPADGAADDHLELLALVAEMFSDSAFRRRLAAATTPSQARGAFAEWADHAAQRPDRS